MAQPQRLYGESRPFSLEAWKYGYKKVNHTSVTIEWLRRFINEQIAGLTEDQVFALAFAGLPGVGKTSQLRHMVSASASALGWGKSPLLAYRHPMAWVDPTFAGRIARNGVVGVVHGDHMFRAIGPDRRGIMLSSTEDFHHHWGDDERLARIFWDIVRWENPTDKVYRGTPWEKAQKEPLWTIEIQGTRPVNGKQVMIIEWVQSIDALARIEAMRGKYQLKTLKILFDVSIVDSLIRLLRREHDQKIHPDGRPYSFAEILEHRLIEQYYILDGFIGPAFEDQSVILLDKPREMPPFRESEIEEIMTFLAKYRPKEPHSQNLELILFVWALMARLQDYFTDIRWISEAEYAVWRRYRDQKKKDQQTTS